MWEGIQQRSDESVAPSSSQQVTAMQSVWHHIPYLFSNISQTIKCQALVLSEYFSLNHSKLAP